MRKFTQILMVGLALLLAQIAIQAQVNGSIAGTVSDPNGAALPGASVRITGTAGQDFTATTNENGQFRVPGVESGVYTVTITAQGFKTTSVKNVKVDIGTPSTVDAKLELGAVGEIVEVSSGGEVLQTQTATVGTTITGRQINQTPISSRDALDLILRLPGVVAVGAPRQSSINGLPKGAISLTLDGVDDQDNVLRSSDGFFTYVRPRVDAIEEVVVSTANPGSEASADGAVSVKFVTKRGTDRYTGAVYEQVRNTALNSGYWFVNRDKPNGVAPNGKPYRTRIQLNQPGAAFGGPIPFLRFGDKGGKRWDSGKGQRFFFVNYEQFRIPGTQARSRTVINPGLQTGTYNYTGTDGTVRTANLFTIAFNNGQTNTIDPNVNNALNAINAATASGGAFAAASGTELNRRLFNFSNPVNGFREFLAARFDFNIGKNHSFEYVQNRQNFHPAVDNLNGNDAPFPGFSQYGQGGIRKTWSFAERATITKSIVNEARYAVGGGSTDFGTGCCGNDFASQGGWNLGVWGALGIQSPAVLNDTQGRTTPTNDFTDNVTWIKGNHTFAFGGQIKRIKSVLFDQSPFVPSVGFGFTSDPADTGSTAYTMWALGCGGGPAACTSLPFSNTTIQAEARSFWAGLVGRVSSYGNSAYLTGDGTYVAGGRQTQGIQQFTYGLFGQDSWKLKSNLTLTLGVRWQPQMGVTNLYKNQTRLQSYEQLYGQGGLGHLFRPGDPIDSTKKPFAVLLNVGEKMLPDDLNNFAPSVGFVWSPNFDKGIMHFLLGDKGKTVFRGGYSTSFVREGLNVALQVGAGPGGSVDLSRSTTIAGSFTSFGTLFRTPGNPMLTPFTGNVPTFPTPAFPLGLVAGQQGFAVDPNLTTGRVDSFSFGLQRELDKDSVLEVRYVGNRAKKLWRLFSVNESNIIENGWAAEFLKAQSNLYNNIAAGRGATFAYFGVGSNTVPLPITFAYINGSANANAGAQTLTQGALGSAGSVSCSAACNNAALYNSTLWSNATIVARLNNVNASPLGFSSDVENSASRRANAIAAGLPPTFKFQNPELSSGAFLLGNTQNSWYDSLVVEYRRRLSHGLRVQASWVLSKSIADYTAVSSIVNSSYSLRPGGLDQQKTYQPFDVRHVFKLDTTYDLPFGRGRTFLSNSGKLVDAIVGGFSVLPVISLQSGTPIYMGNFQLNGITQEGLEKLVKVHPGSGVANGAINFPTNILYFLPEDFIANSIRANSTAVTFSGSTVGNGYGANGAPTGAYLAPAGANNCQVVWTGSGCGFTTLVIHGIPFFKVDLGLSKKIPIGESHSFEIRANALNLLNNPNFRVGGWASNNPGGGCCGSTFGQLSTTSAYIDNSTTNDPGGRVIDIQFRINW